MTFMGEKKKKEDKKIDSRTQSSVWGSYLFPMTKWQLPGWSSIIQILSIFLFCQPPTYQLANLSLCGPNVAAGFPNIVPETMISKNRRMVLFSSCLLWRMRKEFPEDSKSPPLCSHLTEFHHLPILKQNIVYKNRIFRGHLGAPVGWVWDLWFQFRSWP